jgi:subtilisin family serine protease
MEGLAPDVHLINIKALGFVIGAGTDSWIISAMEKAMELKADVVNLSLGGETPPNPEDDPEVEVVSELTKRGIVVVCASGNEGPEPSTICSPAAAPDSLAVAAENEFTGQICDFSSRGPVWNFTKPDCSAPGYKISSGIVGILDALGDRVVNRASAISGTSMSTPHITSMVACMKQLWRGALGKELTTEEVKRLLEVTATAPKDNDRGWGRLSWDRVELYLSTEYGVEI